MLDTHSIAKCTKNESAGLPGYVYLHLIFEVFMSTFLFDKIIFGPVWSRRLGESLGINLLPPYRKVCNFNCLYCECGLTRTAHSEERFPDADEVIRQLEIKLTQLAANSEYLDSITFAGNGEPTLHPDFGRILESVMNCRNQWFPKAQVAVLSNSANLQRPGVFEALMHADQSILKLDSAIENTFQLINCPVTPTQVAEIIDKMKQFNGRLTIQTLFFRGIHKGVRIDNTTEKEVEAWARAIEVIGPRLVMLYSIARETAAAGLEKVSETELQTIANRIRSIGIPVQVTP